jgi:hypothetical protein
MVALPERLVSLGSAESASCSALMVNSIGVIVL